MIAIPNKENDMGVYIPRAVKPTDCEYCLFNTRGGKCYLTAHDLTINDCPLIEIDLVRCGECKYAKGYENGWWCRRHCNQTEPTDFCSYGERRADE